MAEVSQQGGGGKPKSGKPKGKKMSTHIDMTPMVDLAFLLLTFFMLATSFSRPQSLEIKMPKKDKNIEPPKANWQDVLNVVLGPHDRIFYYYINPDVTQPDVKTTDYSAEGIRKVLMDEWNKNTQRHGGEKGKFIVLIKPDEKSRYKNIVDVFDEMNITGITSFALVDLSDAEKKVIPQE